MTYLQKEDNRMKPIMKKALTFLTVLCMIVCLLTEAAIPAIAAPRQRIRAITRYRIRLAFALSSLRASFACFLFSILLFPFQIVDVFHILDRPSGIMQKREDFFAPGEGSSPLTE